MAAGIPPTHAQAMPGVPVLLGSPQDAPRSAREAAEGLEKRVRQSTGVHEAAARGTYVCGGPAQEEKVAEVERELNEAQHRVEGAKGAYETIVRRMAAELARFQRERAAELAGVLRGFALTQVAMQHLREENLHVLLCRLPARSSSFSKVSQPCICVQPAHVRGDALCALGPHALWQMQPTVRVALPAAWPVVCPADGSLLTEGPAMLVYRRHWLQTRRSSGAH